jgi:hypothetical protein
MEISSERHLSGLRTRTTAQQVREAQSFLTVVLFWRFRALVTRLAVGGALPALGGAAVLLFVLLQLTFLRPGPDHNHSDALTVDLRAFALGSYRAYDGQNSRLYVVRMPSDAVRAFAVPLRAGKVAMPDARWGQSLFDCADFRPGPSEGRLSAYNVFQCHDTDLPTWGIYQWRWNLDGNSMAQLPHTHVGDLPRMNVERTASLIRVYSWDVRW